MATYVKISSELYHHGIKGQKWGVRNGPPYPLKPGDHSAAEKKATPSYGSAQKKKPGFKKVAKTYAQVYAEDARNAWKHPIQSTKEAFKHPIKSSVPYRTVQRLKAEQDEPEETVAGGNEKAKKIVKGVLIGVGAAAVTAAAGYGVYKLVQHNKAIEAGKKAMLEANRALEKRQMEEAREQYNRLMDRISEERKQTDRDLLSKAKEEHPDAWKAIEEKAKKLREGKPSVSSANESWNKIKESAKDLKENRSDISSSVGVLRRSVDDRLRKKKNQNEDIDLDDVNQQLLKKNDDRLTKYRKHGR